MPRAQAKKATNLTIDSSLLSSAKELGINLSQAAETGIRNEIAEAQTRRWKLENKNALASSNEYVKKHGLPLEKSRQF